MREFDNLCIIYLVTMDLPQIAVEMLNEFYLERTITYSDSIVIRVNKSEIAEKEPRL